MKPVVIAHAAVALLLLCPNATRAQGRPPANSIETAASSSAVSDGYGNWAALNVRASLQPSARTTLIPEVAVSRQFHDNGTLFALGVIQTLDDDWYAFVAASTSAGAFYLPRARGVAVLNRKLLHNRRLVVNAGGSYTQWKDAHSDVGLSAGAAFYFPAPVVVEVGANHNISRPGNVTSQSYFAAVTEGRSGSHYLIARASGGREAYALIGPANSITNFASHVASLTLRQWLTPRSGVVVGAEYYTNAFYHRTGLTLGGFWNIE
ncbi:MAG: YaiO family outer membrane beta-barrel protein [bacterium]